MDATFEVSVEGPKATADHLHGLLEPWFNFQHLQAKSAFLKLGNLEEVWTSTSRILQAGKCLQTAKAENPWSEGSDSQRLQM